MFTRKNKVLAINGQLLIPSSIKILVEKYRPRNDYHSWELYFHRFHAEYIWAYMSDICWVKLFLVWKFSIQSSKSSFSLCIRLIIITIKLVMTMKITIKLVLKISVQTTTCHYKSQAFSALPKTEESLGLKSACKTLCGIERTWNKYCGITDIRIESQVYHPLLVWFMIFQCVCVLPNLLSKAMI